MGNAFDRMGDTIVAPATAVDRPAALAVVRLSGRSCDEVLGRVFRTGSSDLSTPRMLVLGYAHDCATGAVLDQCMAVRFPHPHSYTGEDCAELHLHGGPNVVRSVLASCVAAGARMASPGEFTRRAFLNGKLDLAQAEAVSALTSAESGLARRAALRQLRGGLSARINSLRERLLNVAAEVECRLDFGDGEVDDLPAGQLSQWLVDIRGAMESLLSSWRRGGCFVAGGVRVALVGVPNAGKSSLFNALSGRDRAIVTAHAGTTRDSLETTLEIGGLAVTLVDTAGLRDLRETDEIEALGIERSCAEMSHAQLVILVLDETQMPSDVSQVENDLRTRYDAWRASSGCAEEMPPVLCVYNKSDLLEDAERAQLAERQGALVVSAKTLVGLDELESTIARMVGAQETMSGDVSTTADLVTNARHAECLSAASQSLENAIATMESTESDVLTMVDVHLAIASLNELLGIDNPEELLDEIFEKFCLGK
ncbi:MAG: tRNA uridine-5-carboxymethylaminomethyl(34) synthesis GTPase MnmE [Candidatus Sumerlaeales bacterium]|nr:tRNA uridine-5-carboxymethylaminomethyl(34) synthesis GTPase MnmE [Candidatus Sumerlaeales bacterium]